MAPNLVASSSSCDSKMNNLNFGGKIEKSDRVRTECIVRHIFNYLIESEYVIDDLPLLNSKELPVFDALKSVCVEFKTYFSDRISEMTSKLDYDNPEIVVDAFLGVANELFCQGITWARISAFFVFTGEIATQCLLRNIPDHIVEKIYASFLKLVQDQLEKWIYDHGGWEEAIAFAESDNKKDVSASSASPSRWAKSALYGTVRVLGTLAYIASLTENLSIPYSKDTS